MMFLIAPTEFDTANQAGVRTAITFYEQALPIAHTVGNRSLEAVTLNNIIGAAKAKVGERATALQSFSRALALAQEVQDPIPESLILTNLMGFWRLENRYDIAIFFGKQAVNKFQRMRAN